MSSVNLEERDSSGAFVKMETEERGTRSRSSRSYAKITPDRRKHRRVAIRIVGRFMREDKQEYPCSVSNMSAGGMSMLTDAECHPGERIVAYLDNFGRIEGVVIRAIPEGFAVRITASQYKREKIANLLTWLINRESLGLSEERKHERVVPRNPFSKLILPNGDVFDCKVIDVSLSGASIAIDKKPPLQTEVILGRMRGRVVRHHDTGVALQFAEMQDPDSIARSFG
jgi:hypothetical protein